MTIQEKIREDMARELVAIDGYEWEALADNLKSIYLQNGSVIAHKLHSQGVVLKVDRELPSAIIESASKVSRAIGQDFIEGIITWDEYVNRFDEVFMHAQKKLDFAGYVAVEPLIELIEVCKHKWLDATNAHVSGTAYCPNCGALAPLEDVVIEPLIEDA